MGKLNYLNLGCGNKFHKDWVNVDLVSRSPYVIQHNLLKDIPYPDNTFDVIYHSQVLEHFEKNVAENFVKECYRVLKPGGIIRIVVPDLENIINKYVSILHELRVSDTAELQDSYDWILLELYDQTIRNKTGGMMAQFLKRNNIAGEDFIKSRMGYVGKSIRYGKVFNDEPQKSEFRLTDLPSKIIRRIKALYRSIVYSLLVFNEDRKYMEVGKFRMSGEIHYWMYDSYSLRRLLSKFGFNKITVKSPEQSDIPDWNKYELDIRNNEIFDPTSLFIEARK